MILQNKEEPESQADQAQARREGVLERERGGRVRRRRGSGGAGLAGGGAARGGACSIRAGGGAGAAGALDLLQDKVDGRGAVVLDVAQVDLEAAARVAKRVVGVAVGSDAARDGGAGGGIGSREELCFGRGRSLVLITVTQRTVTRSRLRRRGPPLTPSFVDVPWRKVWLAAFDGSPNSTTAATTSKARRSVARGILKYAYELGGGGRTHHSPECSRSAPAWR